MCRQILSNFIACPFNYACVILETFWFGSCFLLLSEWTTSNAFEHNQQCHCSAHHIHQLPQHLRPFFPKPPSVCENGSVHSIRDQSVVSSSHASATQKQHLLACSTQQGVWGGHVAEDWGEEERGFRRENEEEQNKNKIPSTFLKFILTFKL